MSLLLAIALAAAAPAAPPPTLTLREAQALSPRDLATRVVGALGQLYQEVRAGSAGGVFGGSGLAGVDLASAPRSAGFPGLCVADRLFVRYGSGGHGADPPRRPESIWTDSVYQIVGEANDRREWTAATERRLEARCSHAGPVLGDPSGPLFFITLRGSSGAKAYMAARMLQAAIARAQAGSIGPIGCTEDPAELNANLCADSRAFLATLPTDRLRSVDVDPCAENRSHLCAHLNFEQAERRGNEIKTQEIVIEVDAARFDPPPDSFNIMSIAIHHQTVAED